MFCFLPVLCVRGCLCVMCLKCWCVVFVIYCVMLHDVCVFTALRVLCVMYCVLVYDLFLCF